MSMSRKATILQYYGSQDDSRCGYCSNPSSSQSHGNKTFFRIFFMDNRTAVLKIIFQFAKQRNGCLIYLFKNYVFLCTSV